MIVKEVLANKPFLPSSYNRVVGVDHPKRISMKVKRATSHLMESGDG